MTRFEIQDIVSQNQDGVTFRALDKSTNKIVSLRRFFPFGQCDEDEEGGEGLDPQEGKAFTSACERLSRVNHPALRRTIFGDTDPVDGMPFLVTEWLEGESLADVLGNNTMEPSMIIGLVRQALDVCMVLSNTLKNEAVWIDTKLEAIIVSNPAENPTFTFRICPFKWLGTQSHQKDLTGIVSMVETLMGWKTKLVSDQAGLGLGGWLKLLRQNPQMALQDALKTLPDPAAAISTAQATASPLGQPAVQQPYILASANQPLLSKKSIIIMAISACVTGALIFFLYQQKSKNADSAPATVEDQNIITQPPLVVPKTLEPTEKLPPTPEIITPKPEPTPDTASQKNWTDLPKTTSKSPIDTPPLAWYDATTAVFHDDKVSIANSAGNGDVISGPATLSSSGIGSLQAVQFNGSNQYLTGNFNHTGEKLTVFFVGKSLNTKQTPYAGMMSVWENGQKFDWDNDSSSVVFSQNDNIADSIYTHRSKTVLSSSTGTLTKGFLANTAFNGSTNTIYLNGNSSPGIPSRQSFKTNKVIIGARWQNSTIGGPYWNGSFGEVMIFNTDLSESDRQKIEGYLANKWGLTAELTASHPDKSSDTNSSSTTETPVSLPKNETPKEEIKKTTPKIRLWTPVEFPLAAWYDAADEKTITASNGAVSQLKDKSKGANDLSQGTTNKQPKTGTRTIGDLNVLDFDGFDDELMDADFAALNTADITIFAVQKYDVTNVQSMNAWALDRTTNKEGTLFHSTFGSQFSLGYRFPEYNSLNYTENTNAELLSYVKTGKSSQQAWVNGVMTGHQTKSVTDFTTQRLALGSRNMANYLKGAIGEFIIVPSVLADAERQKIEGYLAHKWGLVESLPAEHPYKSIVPIPPVLTPNDAEALKTLKVGDPVTLQGTVRSAKLSTTGKSIYLSFSDPLVETDIRVVIHGSEYVGNPFTEEYFSKLIGQNLVFSGTAYTESFNERPPYVKITEKQQIRKATPAEEAKKSDPGAIKPAEANPNTPNADGVLSPDDIDAIAKMPTSKPVSVRGVVKLVKIPDKSSHLYVYFSDVPSRKQIQVVIDSTLFEGGPYKADTFKNIETEFQKLVGKTVTFNGYVRRYPNQNDWQMVSISKRDQFVIEEPADNSAGEAKNQNDKPDKSNPINNIKPGARVKIQAILKAARMNKEQTAIVLMFTEPPQEDQLRGVVYKVNYKDDFNIKNFEAFVGKKVSLDGVLIVDKNNDRFIEITNLNQISLLQQ